MELFLPLWCMEIYPFFSILRWLLYWLGFFDKYTFPQTLGSGSWILQCYWDLGFELDSG